MVAKGRVRFHPNLGTGGGRMQGQESILPGNENTLPVNPVKLLTYQFNKLMMRGISCLPRKFYKKLLTCQLSKMVMYGISYLPRWLYAENIVWHQENA